jgi:prepilin-type N-terminal cleavage/methylation domain-containing protein
MLLREKYGFTIAELLISLGVLALIATFTIPKIINIQQTSKLSAIAKEDMGAVSGAYQLYIRDNGYSSSVSLNTLTTYINYVNNDTASIVDSYPGQASIDCSSGWKCYRMHNGSVMAFDPGQTFGATDPLAVTYFYVDPDGVYSGSTNGSGKSVVFFLYYNQRMSTLGNATAGAHDSFGTTYNPDPTKDPSWLTW